MADSTTNLPTLAVNQSQKEVVQNAINDAASPATYWGRDYRTTGGLVWGYLGGVIFSSGSPNGYIRRPNGTVTLTANALNYVEVDSDGEVSANTTAFTSGRTALYEILTGPAQVIVYDDVRLGAGAAGGPTLVTLTANSGITITGSPGSVLDIALPIVAKGDILVVREIAGSPPVITVDKLGIGADGEVLTADSSQERGLQWSPVDATGGGSGLNLPVNEAPAGPATGMYAFVDRGDLRSPLLIDSSDRILPFGESHRLRVLEFYRTGVGGLFTTTGLTMTSVGSSSSAQTLSGTRYQAASKDRRTSAASINVAAGYKLDNLSVARNASAGVGGFAIRYVWGYGVLNATSRTAVGITAINSAFSLAVEPSATTGRDGVWIAMDSTDTNLRLMWNDNAGAMQTTDLGSDFPRPTAEQSVYDLTIWCEPGASTLKWRLQRLDDPTKVAGGTISTEVMSAGTQVYGHIYVGTGPSAAVASSIDVFRIYSEGPTY